MDKRTRLNTAFDLALPDRPPIMGGWLAAPNHIQALTECSEDEYWADPFGWAIRAEHVLGSDGLNDVFVPIARGAYRGVDIHTLEARAQYTVAGVLEYIAATPSAEELAASFDEEAAYARFIAGYQATQARMGDIVWCPADWSLYPTALWYHKFGYEATFETLALHPNEYRKLVRASAENGRQHAILRARAIRAGIMPNAVLAGEDLCNQRGPMVSPEWLRKEYWPLVEYAYAPLVEVGCKIVWHCDGNVRPILDDILATGVGGLQGFQRECGMELEWIVKRRTRAGDPLLIMGPLQVTTTLPHGTAAEVRAEVRRAMQICRDQASLVFFTSNTIIPDTPLENIRAFWDEVLSSRW